MTPEQIRQLRTELRCTVRELAATLNIPLAELQSWEAGEQFPTKQWVDKMERLREAGPSLVLRKASKKSAVNATPMQQLSNPEFWVLVRKLAAHPRLFEQVTKVAADYEDPATRADT